MGLVFFNTLTRSREDFTPLKNNHVRMYTCGPTIYDYVHIGNFRTFMFEDLLRRFLKYKGFKVTQVMNLTDVDDKTIRGSREKGLSLQEYSKEYKEAFFNDLDTLNMERAEVYPEATKHIKEMVAMIRKLLDKGLAYESGGSIYFSIARFKDYGRLSHMDMGSLKPGARVAADSYEKDEVSDFALWKAWDEEDGDVFWKTELGKGRPGWHIECSAMSTSYLGDYFDIHTGGVDNIFPHHENEIAQSVCSSGQPFVHFWLHSEHLIVEGKKMSKSLGNYYTLRDLLDKGHSPLAIRYLLLATHYRQQLNFTMDGLEAARNGLERYHDFVTNLDDVDMEEGSGDADEYVRRAAEAFEAALDDDLNISPALAVVFDFIRDINRLKQDSKLSKSEAERVKNQMLRFDSVLGFLKRDESGIDSEIEALIDKRNEARRNKQWAEADRIRDELLEKGIILEDSAAGTKWKRKL